MNFKIGDKVKILPSATDIRVAEDEVGKTGVITAYCSPTDIIVLMNKPCKAGGNRIGWCVESSQIKSVIKVGQQLLLWDDILEV